MFTPLATARRRSMRPPMLAFAWLLVWLGQAAAQELQLRADAWMATSLAGRNDDAPASPSLEISAVQSPMLRPAQSLPSLDGRVAPELAGVNVRLWMSRGRADIGVGVGSLGYVLPAVDGLRTVVGAMPTVTLGMRWRVSDQHMLFADASGARGLGADPAATVVTTKLGMEWQPARSALGFENRAIGLQLDSGYRLSLKSRRGGLALYLRNTF